ncbi:MAG: hypothetical protein MI754_01285, partial [Chromatiales bacterium]|nr:hypothetical protein [Chromatiales bacterium]
MKLLFVGSQSAQSVATFEALVAQGVTPGMVFIHTPDMPETDYPHPFPPLITQAAREGPLELAARHGLRAIAGGYRQLSQCVYACCPERVIVSCYPVRIGETLLKRVPRGWFNIHPSRLPEYRGVAPIFWQLKDGLNAIGVTLYRMNSAYDLGPIVDRGALRLDSYLSYSEISHLAGRLG